MATVDHHSAFEEEIPPSSQEHGHSTPTEDMYGLEMPWIEQ